MTKLILVRHGYSEANHDGTFTGQRDVDLNEIGYKQASLAARYIAENYNVDAIYSSDLKRAYNTALPISQKTGIDIITTPAFREIKGGEFEGVSFPELIKKAEYQIFRNDTGNSVFPGGETMREVAERVMSKLSLICKENDSKTVVITTHANPMRVIKTMCIYNDINEMKNIKGVPNASVTIVEFENGVFSLKVDGYDDFLGELHTDFSSKRV